MTVNASSTAEFTIDQLVLAACRSAGLLGPHQDLTGPNGQAYGRMGRDALELRLKWLETHGIQAKTYDFYTLPLATGTDRYSLPTSALDVIGAGAYIPAGTADTDHSDGESLVVQVSGEEWHEHSTKNASGTPGRFYAHRSGAQIEVRLLPKPDEAGFIRFRIQRLLANASDGNATLDLERPWQLAIKLWMAHDLAADNSKPLERVLYLERRAKEATESCLGLSASNHDSQAVIDHDCGWYR